MGIDICQCLCTSCVCLAVPLWLPCYLVWYLSYRRQNPRSEKEFRAKKKHRKANKPKPLPRKRRRLSISFDPDLNSQSPFLRLPAELRLQIYNYVLGGNRMHLVSIPKSVAHIRCQSWSEIWQLCCCIPEPKQNISADEKMYGWLSSANTGILSTCRQVYTEAIEILYSNNTFSVNNLWTLIDFSKAVPPQHLAAVTHLQIVWNLRRLPLNLEVAATRGEAKFDDHMWERFWDVIVKEMSGLVDLRMKLTVGTADDCALEQGWVRPLLEVHGMKRCRVSMQLREEGISPETLGVLLFERKLEDSMRSTACLPAVSGISP